MNRITITLISVAAIGLAAYGLSSVRSRPPPAGPTSAPASPAAAPDFALKDYQGNTVTLAEFRGRPVVVNSWAAWCPFCREELADFAAVQEEFGDRAVIIAVDRAEALEIAKRYSDELGVTGRLIFLLDPGDSFYRSIGGFSMPETIFVDKDGNIRIHKRGPMPLEEIREKVKSLLDDHA